MASSKRRKFGRQAWPATLYRKKPNRWKPLVYTQREIIKWARVYTSDNNQNTKFKEPLKKYDHIRNRRATKKAIKEENFDNIPQKDKVKKRKSVELGLE